MAGPIKKISIGYRADSRLLCVLLLPSNRVVYSEKVSKSKPFGILRFSQFRITLLADGRSRYQQQEEHLMFTHLIRLGSTFLFASILTVSSPVLAGNDGVITVKSAYSIRETIERLKKDIADKGIKFFNEIDQSQLAADAGIKLRPSVLLIFGNPPLGTQFITANATAGLDWPVRLLVYESEKGEVWTAYTDFDWIARRHGIKNRQDQFKMASSVITSITSSVKAK
jgi:uncharacterized protein (DUF302 family)